MSDAAARSAMAIHSLSPMGAHSPDMNDEPLGLSMDQPEIAMKSVAIRPTKMNVQLRPSDKTSGFSPLHFVRVRIIADASRMAAISGRSAYALNPPASGFRMSSTPANPRTTAPHPFAPTLSPMNTAANNVM